jgi:internalin A
MFAHDDPQKAFAEAEQRIRECRRKGERGLNLSGLGLVKLPPSVGDLTQLLTLHVPYNRLRELPAVLSNLKQLRDLRIDHNEFVDLPPFIGDLKQLRALSLNDNCLSELPEAICRLQHLRTLEARSNNLRTLPASFGQLQKLEGLDLVGNQLRDLPESFAELRPLKALWLDYNSDLGIPSEIWHTGDPRKVFDYYHRLRSHQKTLPLNEFKLILVGRGGVGKTTLVQRLLTGKYQVFQRTPGVKITPWRFRTATREVEAHVWDFGGQEIMHGTHRFFMTERALYLVLVSSRENTEDHDADYWLSLVRSFGGTETPVIVLLNKWSDASFELNRELLRDKHGRDLIFLETDSHSGHGIDALKKKISQLANALPGLNAKWPSDWHRVKKDLPAAKRNWLSFTEFRAFCADRGVHTAKDQEDLAESLHDLGLILAYRKDKSLRGFGVLNPQWVTKGIYDMLNAPELRAQNGRFTPADFGKVLPTRKYPAALHAYLLALMRKFRLCFPLGDDGQSYLIPDLLTKEEPKLEADFPAEQCLGFVYRYESVLPEGLLPRFIVETYVHREQKYAWRTGVVLERSNCRAFVRGDLLGRTVTIRVTGIGNGPRELLGIIREHFERIHRSFEKLPVTELVPAPGHPSVLIPYVELLAYEQAGDDEYKIVIDVGENYLTLLQPVKFSVRKILDAVDISGTPRRQIDDALPGTIEFDEAPLSVFVSYSHKDERFRDELRGALTAYERKGELIAWDDTRIEAGQKWEREVLSNLERANLILLLLSNDFICSDYCMQKEWEVAKRRDAAGECAIVPIVVRACPFEKLEFGQIQAILPGHKPVKQHRDRDAAWLEVTKELDRVIDRLEKARRR